jgi:hypothetical protein
MGDLLGSLIQGAKNGPYCVSLGWGVTNGIRVIAQLEMGECAQAHEGR